MARLVPVLIFALSFPTVMTCLYFTHAHSAMKLGYGVGKIIQFALPVVYWALADRGRLVRPRWSRAGLGWGLAFGLAVGVGICALYFSGLRGRPMIAEAAGHARSKMESFGLTSPALFVLFALFLSSLHALLEEYYWRAFVFAELKKLARVELAVFISSLGFMAHHVIVLDAYFQGRFWTATLPFSLAIAVGGAVWAWMYHRFESIGPAWLSHAMVDAAIMLVGYDLLFR